MDARNGGELIKDKFGVTLSANSVGRLLAQIGITCQKPLHRALERDEALVQQALVQQALVQHWLKKEFPKIKALAQCDKADIFFGDALICARIITRGARGARGAKRLLSKRRALAIA